MASAHFLPFSRVGKQVVKDAGPLTRKRMEAVADEFHARSLAFIEKSAKAGKPFFLWQSSTRPHAKTLLSPKWEKSTGFGLVADGMAELDYSVDEILKRLDDLKIAFQMLEGNFFNSKRVTPNMPFVVNLRQDPFERFSSESMEHFPWMMGDKFGAFVQTQVVIGQFLQSFREYPRSQKSGSFGVDQALQAIQAGSQGGGK